jgi:hypothetical protein
MNGRRFRKTNHLAVAGFLLPFAAAGLTGLLIIIGKDDFEAHKVSIFYLTLVPLILLSGLVLSIKSIPMIPDRGDKDYAYSGLTLNALFLFVFIISLIYLFFQ